MQLYETVSDLTQLQPCVCRLGFLMLDRV